MLCKVHYNLTAQSFSDLSSLLSDNQFVISVDIMLDYGSGSDATLLPIAELLSV